MISGSKKKFLYVFLPIIAVVVMAVSIIGGIVASEKSGGLDLTPYLAVEANGDASGDSGSEELNEVITYTVKGCNFSGTGTFINVKAGTSYVIEDCNFSGSQSSAIMVNNGALSISNSNFTECEGENGGAISLVSDENTDTVLLVDGCTFDSCRTTDLNGGAIYVYSSGLVNIKNSSFVNNFANGSGGAYFYSYKSLEGVNLTNIENSRFIGNTAGNNGGAINAYIVTMTNSAVAGNTAGSNGGGVYLNPLYSTVSTITDSCIGSFTETVMDDNGVTQDVTYAGNSATYGGGIASVGGIILTIDGASSIKSNVAEKGAGLYSSSYGIINIEGESIIDSNEASSDGGGVYSSGGSTLNISESAKISNNTAEGTGGGLYCSSSNSTITDSVQITNNTAIEYGGGVYIDYSGNVKMSINGAVISYNTAIDGGGIYTASRLELLGTTLIVNNTASGDGGGVFSSSYLTLLDSASITSNTATTGSGGGLYWDYNANGDTVNFGSSTTAWSGKISDNTAYKSGGGIRSFGANITQYGGEISSNSLTSSIDVCRGAGVYFGSSIYRVTYTMQGNATIKGNKCDSYSVNGGGIYLQSSNSSSYFASLVMNDTSTILEHDINGFGGGVYVSEYSNLTMNGNSSISKNYSYFDGGGIYNRNGTVTLNDNSSVESNTTNSGGGISSSGGTVNLNGASSVKDNIARLFYGGGIYSYDSDLNLGTSSAHWTGEISGNTAYGLGGGLYIEVSSSSSNKVYYQYGGKISGNKLTVDEYNMGQGAGVYITGSSNVSTTYVMHGVAEISDNGVVEYGDDGVTIKNDYRAYDGGGIYLNNVGFTMNDTSKISGNSAKNNGGGVHMASSNGASYNNTAEIENNTAGNDGGGIYAGGKSVYLYDYFNIEGNTAGNNGGGIYSTNLLELNENSSITGNMATNNGGGVYSSTVRLGNTTTAWTGTIDNNTAGQKGGGIYYTATSLYQNGGEISNNKLNGATASTRHGAGIYFEKSVTYTMAGSAGINGNGTVVYGEDGTTILEDYRAYDGGGIYFNGSANTLTLNDSAFISENNSSNNGGGIYDGSANTLTLNDSAFISENNSSNNGGGIFIGYGRVNLKGVSSSIYGNTATKNGGGIYSVYANITLDNGSEIYNNSASDGGGVLMFGGTITANAGSAILQNSASLNGGGISLNSSANANLSGTIEGNSAGQFGGGVFANSSTIDNVCNGTISSNTATNNGGGLYLNSGTWNLSGSTITGNSAQNGGGFCVVSSCTLNEMTNITISDNTARASGGGIYNDGSNLVFSGLHKTENGTNVVDTGVTFDNNTAVVNGGAIFHYSSNLTVNGSYDEASQTYSVNFTRNSATTGGAIYNQSTLSYSATLNGCLISDNTATATNNGGGGGIYNYNSTLVLSQTARVSLRDNSARTHGGAIASMYNSTVTFLGTTDVSSNTAGNNGGGMYFSISTLQISVETIIDGNTAKNGGGLYMSAGSQLKTLANVIVQENTATENGGGIYNTGSTINTMSTNSIVNVNSNTALIGGGLFLSNATYSGSKPLSVSGNYAKKADGSNSNGAGVYLYAGNISNYEITQNYGHGLFVAAENSTVSNMFINDNSSSGVYVNATTTISNSEISNNKASIGAGILHSNSGTLTISGTTKIYGNVASSSGGGIYTTGGGNLVLNFDDASYTDSEDGLIYHTYGIFSNTATNGNGGGIFAVNSTVTITNAGIYDNTAGNYGGGIHQESGTITYSEGGLYRNSANFGGGAYVNSGTLTSNVGIFSNSSRTDGGGIYTRGTVNLTQYVQDNNASSAGGGIYILTKGILNVTDNANVTTNTAGTYGGGIENHGLISVTTGKALNVFNNTSTNEGGGMHVSSGLVDASGDYVCVYENTSTDSNIEGVYYSSCKSGDVLSKLKIYNHAGYGLGILAKGATIQDMEIYNQTVYGGVYVNTDATISDGVKIYDNHTDYNGGGIYFNGFITGSSPYDLTITGSAHIYSNSTYYTDGCAKGGGIYCYGGNLTISTNLDLDTNGDYTAGVTNNTAFDMGAGIFATNNAVVILEKGFVAKNGFVNPPGAYTFSKFGGGIFFGGKRLEIGVDGRVVDNTENITYGGGIYLCESTNSSTAQIYGIVKGNTAQTNGGGIAAMSGTSVRVANSYAQISNNAAINYFGGGIYANKSNIEIEEAVLSFNSAAAGNGGAVYLTNSSKLNVYDGSLLEQNTAISGGAIFSDGCAVSVGLSTFNKNTVSADGGAIMIVGTSANDIIFGTGTSTPSFTSNTATNFGGAIGLSSCSASATSASGSVIITGEFFNNKTGSAGKGGAIGVDNASVNFIGQIYGGTTKTAYSTSYNALYGGGVYVESTGKYFSSADTIIHGCKAQVGGGIMNLGNASVYGAISYCYANMGGGAVNAGTLHFYGSIASCDATTYTDTSDSIATVSSIYLYGSSQIDGDICIGRASGSLISTMYGKIYVQEALNNGTINLTFADVNLNTMQITSTGTSSGAFTYYANYTTRVLIEYSSSSYLKLNASSESADFTCAYGTIKKRTSATSLYLYS